MKPFPTLRPLVCKSKQILLLQEFMCVVYYGFMVYLLWNAINIVSEVSTGFLLI